MRFTPKDVEQWREEGFVVIENLFEKDEYEPVLQDYELLYGNAGKPKEAATSPADTPQHIRRPQFANIDVLPYQASSAINLIALHPELIAFARALLSVDDVRLYQCHTWAKYTGETDYDQPFHCDYTNHTLTVPGDVPKYRTADFILYLTDVTRHHGPMCYVPKHEVEAILGAPALSAPDDEQQKALRERERAVVVPAGSLVAHGIDTMHRGSNLTAPNGRRFSMTVGYKAAGNDQIAFHAWQARRERPWHLVFNHATPEQLACLGIPKPGDPFWSRRTLELTQARWPDWDMAEYFAAL